MSAALLFDLNDMDTPFARIRVVAGKVVVEEGEVPDDVLEKPVVVGDAVLTPLVNGDIWLQAWAESFNGVIAGVFDPEA